ncbi:Methylsterol monooxygenase 1-2 [Diplonema papillatum]|nr:Methylsterol monooxygenase 1-2 [Diplonema papillatum]
MEAVSEWWHPVVVWGIPLTVASNVGFWGPALLLDWAARQPWCEQYLIKYPCDSESRRDHMRRVTWQNEWKGMRVDYDSQVAACVLYLAGPKSVVGSLLFSYVFSALVRPPAEYLPDGVSLVLGVSALLVVTDFFNYWLHRAEHSSRYLWENWHSMHHAIDTPSAVSSLIVHDADTFFMGLIPVLLAMYICQQHPVTCWVYIMVRVAESACNHSGIEAWWLDIVMLKFLPFRAPTRHHDAHHRFSNYGGDAKNYGEMFWIWDVLFGTYKHVGSHAQPGKMPLN